MHEKGWKERKAELFFDLPLKNPDVQKACAENVTKFLTVVSFKKSYFEVNSPPSPASPSDKDFYNPPRLPFLLSSKIPPPHL